MASVNRAADAIIAALSVQSASGASAASGSAARSSEFAATPPTTAIRLGRQVLGRRLRALDERPHDRALVRRGEIGAAALELVGSEVADRVEERRLEAREREVEPGNARDRERVGLGITLARETVELGAAGVAEAEQARTLVEGLAGRVVERRPDAPVAGVIGDVEQERVPAAREQAQERRLDRVRLQVERGHVTVEVVDRDERQAARPGERLGRGEPHEQRPDQARAGRDGDPIHIVEARARLAVRLSQDREHQLEVAPRRNLRDDSAVASMQVGLGGDHVRPDLAVVRDERGGRLVAGRLERQNHRLDDAWRPPQRRSRSCRRPRESSGRYALAASRTGSFHMISASSRLSV